MNRKQRRLLESLNRRGYSTPVSRLSDAALEEVVADLGVFGSRPDRKHREALMRIVGTFSFMAYGETTGRYAFPLPTGCGKTQSVIAWCSAVHRLETGHSVVVAASKVEDLCDIHRKLVAKGIPEDNIGIIHSKAYDATKAADWLSTRDPQSLTDSKGRAAYASLPTTTDNDNRQFLLVTHARVQSRRAGSVELLNTYHGKRRDLCIWDESLIASQSRGMSKLDLEQAAFWFTPGNKKAAAQSALDYTNECRTILEAELAGQLRDKRPPQLVRLPERSEIELDTMAAAAMTAAAGNGRVTEALRTFFSMCQGDLRVAAVNQGEGAYVTYDIVVPAELRSVAILDASYTIRQLETMDKTILRDPGFDGNVKAYDKVTINHLRHGSGRVTIAESFKGEQREERKVSAELCTAISTIPEDEGVIVFTFKPRDGQPDIPSILRKDMAKANIDTTATVVDDEGKIRPRFGWLTWGQETSISNYKYCRNVVFAGVLHRKDMDLAGAIIGQHDDMLADVSMVAEVQRSEVAHCLYQAMSRGACRDTIDGHAKPMSVWLIHHDNDIREIINKVMPGVVWQDWEPKYLDAIEAKADDLVVKLATYLRTLDTETIRVSTRAIKAKLDIGEVSKRTFSRAVRKIAEGDMDWTLEGQSLVRCKDGLTAISA